MILSSVHVKNFRSMLDETVECDCLTALLGRNGAGKSSFLSAIELFYEPSAKVTNEDFYDEDTSQDIEIALTYSDLRAEERKFFSAYIDQDKLTVVRIFSQKPGQGAGTYHGMRFQNPEFSDVRNAGSKTDIRKKYNELRETEKYSNFPSVRSADQALQNLQDWENANLDSCIRMKDDGQFFGFTGVGQGYLGRYTRCIRIPAVRDATEDATEKRGSCVTEIMDLVVRSALAERQEVTNFKKETQTKYEEVMDPSKLSELNNLETQLSKTLQIYVPDSRVLLDWDELTNIDIPMPQAQTKLLEDGYESSVHRTGHGLQRAFILTMLQHLVTAREKRKFAEESDFGKETSDSKGLNLPNHILAIEEPELYQHPSRQRHFASILRKLASGNVLGGVPNTQVIYSTHAPLFVGLDHFDQIRLFRKVEEVADKPKITKVKSINLEDIARDLWNLDGRPGDKYTAEALRARMQAVMTPWMNEGFFANVAVMVEGEGDRASLLAVASFLGHDFESMGICVLPCMSKNNLDRPTAVFKNLGIQTYLVWDNDRDDKDHEKENAKENRRLLRLIDAPEEDWPNGVWNTHACLDCNLEDMLRKELPNTVFDGLLEQMRAEFRMKKSQALKNPFVLRRVIEKAGRQSHLSNTLKDIVESIIGLQKTETEQQ